MLCDRWTSKYTLDALMIAHILGLVYYVMEIIAWISIWTTELLRDESRVSLVTGTHSY